MLLFGMLALLYRSYSFQREWRPRNLDMAVHVRILARDLMVWTSSCIVFQMGRWHTCCVKLTALYRYWRCFCVLLARTQNGEWFKPVPDKAKLGNDGRFERYLRNAKCLTSPRVTGRHTTRLSSTSACRHQMDSGFSLVPWRTWKRWVMTRTLFMPSSLRAIAQCRLGQRSSRGRLRHLNQNWHSFQSDSVMEDDLVATISWWWWCWWLGRRGVHRSTHSHRCLSIIRCLLRYPSTSLTAN